MLATRSLKQELSKELIGYLRVKLEKMAAERPSGALTSCHTTKLTTYYSSLILFHHQLTASYVFPFLLFLNLKGFHEQVMRS